MREVRLAALLDYYLKCLCLPALQPLAVPFLCVRSALACGLEACLVATPGCLQVPVPCLSFLSSAVCAAAGCHA